MKKTKIIGAIALVSSLFISCDDYLDKFPIESQTEATAFKTYDNFKTYAWNLYGIFDEFSYKGESDPNIIKGDRNSDNLSYSSAGNESIFAFDRLTPTQNMINYDYAFIRKANVMLDNIEASSMSQADKDYWRSVGLFFRSLRYYQLLSTFGDIQWVEHTLTENDTDILYGESDPRDLVAKNILNDLIWAEEHIKADGEGSNTINVHVVRALLSRFALYEGTWRKYHNLSEPEVYLNACIKYSEKLIDAYPNVCSRYDLLFNSEKLGGVDGVILYRAYATSNGTHMLNRYNRSSSWFYDMSKDGVNSYLCTNGKPIYNPESGFAGDKTMYDEFRNRDRRLYYTVTPPYKVNKGTPNTTWTYTDDPQDREYIDLMTKLETTSEGGSGTGVKALPVTNWNTGEIVQNNPNFRKQASPGFFLTELGYIIYKFSFAKAGELENTTDCPIFRIEEALLNYAEAKWEMGQFDQSVADRTINKLRPRAGVALMKVSDINASFDPKRDQAVDPVLWEIRRERRVELMAEGFRMNDLKRWHKGEYVNKQQTGAWIKKADYPKLEITGGTDTEGYIKFFNDPVAMGFGWKEYMYVYPIPQSALTKNPNLGKTPGYDY